MGGDGFKKYVAGRIKKGKDVKVYEHWDEGIVVEVRKPRLEDYQEILMPAWAQREEEIKPILELGNKKIIWTREGHEDRYGTPEEKEERFKGWLADFNAVHTKNPNRPKSWCHERLVEKWNKEEKVNPQPWNKNKKDVKPLNTESVKRRIRLARKYLKVK